SSLRRLIDFIRSPAAWRHRIPWSSSRCHALRGHAIFESLMCKPTGHGTRALRFGSLWIARSMHLSLSNTGAESAGQPSRRSRFFAPGSGTVPDGAGRLTRGFSWLFPAILTLFWTACNAAKPLHIDDATYYRFARQALEHPTDPYGFSILYFNRPLPANHVLAPPVVPYWWAAGMRVLGNVPWLWKIWFLPFAALFVFGLWDLLQA